MPQLLKAIQVCFLGILLMLLNISLPIVLTKVNSNQDLSQKERAERDPYSNSSEEKTSSASFNIAEEYLHEGNCLVQLEPWQLSNAFIHAQETAYIAFHSELHYPPPNITAWF